MDLHVVLHRIAEQIDLRSPHHHLLDIQGLRLQFHPDVLPVRDTIPVRDQGQCHRSVAQHRHPYRIPGSRHPAYLQLEAPLHVRQRVLRTLLPCRHIQHHCSGHRRAFPGFHHHAAYHLRLPHTIFFQSLNRHSSCLKIPDTKQKCTDYNCKPPSLLPPFPSHLLFHLPKVSSFPHFPHTFRRWANAALPRELPLAAFSRPPYLSHLPKAGIFPRFPHTFRR